MSNKNKQADFPTADSIRELRTQQYLDRRDKAAQEALERNRREKEFRVKGEELAKELLPSLAAYVREEAEEPHVWNLSKFIRWIATRSYALNDNGALLLRYTTACWQKDQHGGGLGPDTFFAGHLAPQEEVAREAFLSTLETVLKSHGFKTERYNGEETLRWSLG